MLLDFKIIFHLYRQDYFSSHCLWILKPKGLFNLTLLRTPLTETLTQMNS